MIINDIYLCYWIHKISKAFCLIKHFISFVELQFFIISPSSDQQLKRDKRISPKNGGIFAANYRNIHLWCLNVCYKWQR